MACSLCGIAPFPTFNQHRALKVCDLLRLSMKTARGWRDAFKVSPDCVSHHAAGSSGITLPTCTAEGQNTCSLFLPGIAVIIQLRTLLTALVTTAAIAACSDGSDGNATLIATHQLQGCADTGTCASNPPLTIGGERPADGAAPAHQRGATQYHPSPESGRNLLSESLGVNRVWGRLSSVFTRHA